MAHRGVVGRPLGSDACRAGFCVHHRELARLRRDLHDGLGPSLAGIMVRAELIGQLLTRDEAAGLEVLRELRDEASAFLAEMRRVLADRAPAELEDRDLAFGLDVLARRMVAASGGSLRVSVDVDGAVGALTWTVQVAAFWIVKEALTNVVKHADASVCVVRVWVDGGLRLSVVDDGCGGVESLGLGEPVGVGLSSMRERAAELGGFCYVADSGVGTGTGAGTGVGVGVGVGSGTGARGSGTGASGSGSAGVGVGRGVTVTAYLPEGLDSHDRAA